MFVKTEPSHKQLLSCITAVSLSTLLTPWAEAAPGRTVILPQLAGQQRVDTRD